jgi:WS/DGAT/MGAT family acyltransferase
MIARVHHCMVDGVSGVDLLKIILDISPQVPKLSPPPERPPQPPRPDPSRRFFDTLLGNMQEGMDRLMEFQNGLLNLTQALTNEQSRQSMRETSGTIPGLASPVTMLPFNRQCSGDRKLVWSTFSFAEARAIRAALGGTVNDVVLTALSGAVSRYVEMHGQQIKGRQLRVMVPVSLRQEGQRGALGNLVSMLPVEIPLDMPDPVERFQYINRKTASMKSGRVAEGLNLFAALMGILPAPVHAFAGALASMPIPIPAFNMVSTNVPVGYAIGCGCAIMSYDQNLYFGLTSDTQAMPDVEKLKEALDQSFIELRAAAGVEEIKPKVMKARRGKRQ